MVMTTRTEFLANGLVPITITRQSDNTDCSICGSEYATPVSLPCGHIFDKACIERWLTMKGRNTCPMCKTVLFTLSPDEDIYFGHERREQLTQALRSSGLSQTTTLSNIDRFGCPPPSVSMLQRSIPLAVSCLAEGVITPGATAVAGTAIVRTNILAPNFIAIGNLVPALASVQGRPYNKQDTRDWQLVLEVLWSILVPGEGRKVDAADFANKLQWGVEKLLQKHYSDADKISFLFRYADPSQPNPYFVDLQFVLDYVALLCNLRHKQEVDEAAARKAEKARKRAAWLAEAKGACEMM